MIEAAKQDQNRQVYPFIVIGSETSIRRMEIVSIRREHIDLAGRVIYVPKAKAGTREQPITRASCRRAFYGVPLLRTNGDRLRETTVVTACRHNFKKESAKVSRTIRRFHAHGLIAKIPPDPPVARHASTDAG